MKTKHFTTLFIGLVGSLFFFSACNSESQIKVPDEIETALYEKYKDYSITSLEWSLEDNFFVGEYRRSKTGESYYCKSWFDANGKWLMTETMDFACDNDLLSKVIQNFVDSGYSKSNIIEIYEVDFSEVERRYLIQTKEKTFFYRSNGYLFKCENSNWENRPIVIDSRILNYISENFESTTTIIDADMKSAPLSVDIFEERYKTVCFDSPTQWLATFWRIPSSEKTPDVAKEALAEITGGKTPSERYQMEYFFPQDMLMNFRSKNSFTSEENKKIVYIFKFSDGVTNTVYIDESGQEIKPSDIPAL